METKPMSREELAREVELLKSKIQTSNGHRSGSSVKPFNWRDAINQRVYA
jgi:hypothetical protein